MHDDFDSEIHSAALLEFTAFPYVVVYVALRDALTDDMLLMSGPLMGLN